MELFLLRHRKQNSGWKIVGVIFRESIKRADVVCKASRMSHVFLIHGLIELIFGLLNFLTSNTILLPGDKSPASTSLALLGGELWSYSIICLGLASLSVAHVPDSDRGKQVLGIVGLLYNFLIVWSAVSRAWRGWIFIGNRPGLSWHIAAIIVHGTMTLWFLMWLVQVFVSSKQVEDKQADTNQSKVVRTEKTDYNCRKDTPLPIPVD